MIPNKTKCCLLVLMFLCCLAACRQKVNEQQPTEIQDTQNVQVLQDVRLAPGDYRMDKPDNLMNYFENICHEYGAEVAVHINDYDDSMKVWQAVKLLDDFKSGRRTYYPDKEVRKALDAMAFQLGYCYSHGCYGDTNYAEIFFFRFLEQAVRLSPQVDFVTDFHSADGKAGILNYHEWSINPLYSFLIYPTDDGLRVQMVGEGNETKIEKLFPLTDNAGREYYLCSNNGKQDNGFYSYCFRQYLFMREGGKMRLMASINGDDWLDNEEPIGIVIFNPRLSRWDCCKRNGDTFQRIEGTPSLLLHLEGEQSHFQIVEE